MAQWLVLISSVLLVALCLLVFKGERKKHFWRFMKVLAVVYFAWAFFRFMLSDTFIWVINKGVYSGVYYEKVDILQSILRWGQYASYVILPMAVFFNSRLFKNLAIYFTFPFTILTLIFYPDFMAYFMASGGRGIVASLGFRHFYFSVELVLGLVMPMLLILIDRHRFDVKNKKEWLNFFASLPFILLALMPIYIPQSLVGYTSFSISAFTLGNFAWILITIIEIVVLYYLFRFKPYKQRYMVVMFLALGLFMHYNSMYLMGFSIARLPIQLCNLGAYFFVLALLIKNVKFFNFVFLANIMGTIIAMLMPDVSGGIAGFWNTHFLLEHMQVLAVPSLAMLLRIFPRIEKSALKHLVVGFTFYFLFCLVSGTILNAFAEQGGYGKVNYFYLFDIKKMLDYLPFLSFSIDFKIVLFSRFEIYPIFVSLIYMGFLFLCLLLYFGVVKLYTVLDDHFELRKSRIKIYETLFKRKYKGKIDYTD